MVSEKNNNFALTLQERWHQQTDKDLPSWGEVRLFWATGLSLGGGPGPVLPEQVTGPAQL